MDIFTFLKHKASILFDRLCGAVGYHENRKHVSPMWHGMIDYRSLTRTDDEAAINEALDKFVASW